MSLENWNPWEKHVQGGLKEYNYLSGKNTLLCVGPPYLNSILSAMQAGSEVLYPVGLAQNFAIAQNTATQQIHEIGSEKPYFFRGRTVRQITIGRVVYHGPSLLRVLYAWYKQNTGKYTISPAILDVFGSDIPQHLQPLASGASGTQTDSNVFTTGHLPEVHLPPGYENLWINLASDLFRMPTGLFLLLRDNEDNNVAAYYAEQCHVPTHTMAVDSQGLIIQETISIICGNLLPIKIDSVKVITGNNIPQKEFVDNGADLTGSL